MRKSVFAAAIAAAVFACLAGAYSSAASEPDSSRSIRHSSSSASYVAWSRFDDFETGTARIVVSDLTGHRVVAISHPPAGSQDIDPKISPNGKRILFERDLPTRSAAFIINADGSNEHEIDLRCTDPCVGTNTPTWAPDGKHLLYDRVSGPFDEDGNATSALLWKSTLDGSRQSRFSEPGIDALYEETDASFLPNGYVIVVRVKADGSGTAVFRLAPDGTHSRQLTPWELDADLPDASPAKDGPTANLVVFETYGHGIADDATVGPAIATVPATCRSVGECTAKIRYLTSPTALPEQNFNPAWSPDGRNVVYTRFIPGTDAPSLGDIWRVRYDGKHRVAVSTDARFEFRPDWGALLH